MNHRVKVQREEIRRIDESQELQKKRTFEAELEMRVLDRIHKRKMIEYQKSMAANSLPKT